MMRNKKAQAAMEFLMTYGWALIVVMVAIGALAYLGVLNPNRFLPEGCVLGPGLNCEYQKITESGNSIQMRVTNGFGRSIDFLVIHIKKEVATSNEVCGGQTAIAALSIDPNFGKMQDGETRELVYTDGFGKGISCDPTKVLNCCAAWGFALKAAYPSTVKEDICTANCVLSARLPTVGSKVDLKLVVNYKFSDETIMHTRIGSVSGLVE